MARLSIALPGSLPRPRLAGATAGPLPRVLDRTVAAWRETDGRWLTPLFLLFLCKQLLLVAIIGPFTGHDEVDHYWYIARLAAGDGPGEVGEVLLPPEAEPFRAYVADYPYNAEMIQPPLYHALLVPLWWVAGGDVWDRLYALRLVSVIIGMGVIWLAYLLARRIFPDHLVMRAGVPAFVAFQPQFSFEAAIVNHDILVICLFTAVSLLLIDGLADGFTTRREVAIGLLTLAGLWTKISFGLILPATLLAVAWAWWDRRRGWRDFITALYWLAGSLFLTVALPLLGLAPWFLRSYLLYGDPTGSRRLREVSDFGESASTYREMLTSPGFWEGRLEDFWSNYGWRLIPFDPIFNHVLWSIWGVAIGLTAIVAVRELLARWLPISPWLGRFQWRSLAVLTLTILSLGYGVLYVGTLQFTQSRFIFPAMAAIATVSLLGVDRLVPRSLRPAALALIVGLLFLLNAVSAVRFVIPFYDGPGGGAGYRP